MILAATEDLLGVLKYAVLALLYLFFARVLWAVWSEVRAPKPGHGQHGPPGQHGLQHGMPPGLQHGMPSGGPLDPTAKAPFPVAIQQPTRPKPRAKRTKGVAGSRLVIVEPKARKGSAYGVESEITAGRNETCVITIPDDTFASGLHARVYRDAGSLYIDDLGSTNGTFVNGRRITSATALSVGDSIQIGQTIIEVD